MRVLTTIKKNILSKIILGNQRDLFSHLYYCILNIKRHLCFSKEAFKKTRVVNLYDNKTSKEQV